jgi:hypothetical protein
MIQGHLWFGERNMLGYIPMWPLLLKKIWQFLVHRLKYRGYSLWLESWLVYVVVDLGLQKLDALVMIYKNWQEDVWVGCHFANKNVGEFFTFEIDFLEAHEKKLDQFGYFEDHL